MIHVTGSPIGGENPPHERRWRAAIAAAAANSESAAGVCLHFRVEPHRPVDLDNLVRPALAGLRDAGVFQRGYKNLDAILATKEPAESQGVDIDTATADMIMAVRQPTRAAMTARHAALPRDGDRASKREWREVVRRQRISIEGSAWLDIAVNTPLSLEGLLKPIIDGLGPFLGDDPSASREFSPNDERVQWLRIGRQPGLPCAVILAAGPMNS